MKDNLRNDSLLRIWDIIGRPGSKRPTCYQTVNPDFKVDVVERCQNKLRFPRPTKLGSRVTVWRASEIRELIDGLGKDVDSGSKRE